MGWILTKGLEHFRGQVNRRFPRRDKASDGTIGNQAHAAETSGHNPDKTGRAEYRDGDALDEVRAWDMDADLRDEHGITTEQFVQHVLGRLRSLPAGATCPFRYIIFKRRTWRKANGWRQEPYSGASPHDEHVHFSGDYSNAADNWSGDLGLDGLGISKGNGVTTSAQNWAQDIDPSAGTYSAGGALWTVLGRSAALNSMPPAIADLKATLDALVAEENTDIDALTASLALISGQLSALLADPNEVGESHPIVAAVRYVLANPK